jgi:hypothetical protein
LVDDAVCQQGTGRIVLRWDPFVDGESGIDHIEVALGSVRGSKDLTGGWLTVDATATGVTVMEDAAGNDLALFPGMNVYALVKAVSRVNMSVTLMSNGIAIAFPRPGGTVTDGLGATDARFQFDPTSMSASWVYEDPCEILSVEAMIVRCVCVCVCVRVRACVLCACACVCVCLCVCVVLGD